MLFRSFIKDSLLFPYFSGLTFSLSVVRTEGWKGFDGVFARPPTGSQQIMHPSLYRSGKTPAVLKLELPDGVPVAGWNKLEENTMGEFGWMEILKQFLDAERAKRVAAAWDGDDYVTFEQKDSKQPMVFERLRFDTESTASRFFGAYADALAKRYSDSKDSAKGAQFLGQIVSRFCF